MANKSEKIIKGLTLILIVLLFLASYFNKNILDQGINTKDLIKTKIENINFKDDKYIDSLVNIVDKKIEVNSKQLKDYEEKLNITVDRKEDLANILKDKNDEFRKLYSENLDAYRKDKNKIVFEYETSKINNQTNIWLIILIILTAGIIGGWARINYGLLLPLKNDLETLISKMKAIKEEIEQSKNSQPKDDTPAVFTKVLNTVGQKTDDFENQINSILNELPTKRERVNTSIIFGVIASSITLLALKLADSEVLKFNDNMDYFILWAWCLMGAVYAKDSLERIYKSNFSKNE